MGQYRKAFTAKGFVARATAHVIGLGYYKLHVSGQRVSTHELGAFTTFEERVYYDSIDVSAAINSGLVQGEPRQAIGVSLGDG